MLQSTDIDMLTLVQGQEPEAKVVLLQWKFQG